MSGHSHWASIKHKKQESDAKKGKEFSKIARVLMTAARDGGADPTTNIKLQVAIDQAREVNMPKENIDRAIKKGAGGDPESRLESATYEGFGPAGTAFLVDTITDNRNRTISEIRKIFDTKGGRLGEVNSVRRLFNRKGFLTVPGNAYKEDDVLNAALEAGADDAQLVGDLFEITCDPKDFETVKNYLKGKNFKLGSAEITFVPTNYVPVQDKNESRKILELMESLEDHDDVQKVYANFDIPDAIIAEVSSMAK